MRTFHHTEDTGTKPPHTAPHLVGPCSSAISGWAWRELEWQTRHNPVAKGWVGYPVFVTEPDHTALERLELWGGFHQHRTIFGQVMCQIDHDSPRERQQAQIGDSYALHANAAKESLVRLFRHACQRLLAALAEADPVDLVPDKFIYDAAESGKTRTWVAPSVDRLNWCHPD